MFRIAILLCHVICDSHFSFLHVLCVHGPNDFLSPIELITKISLVSNYMQYDTSNYFFAKFFKLCN